jgi:hypothetical protein
MAKKDVDLVFLWSITPDEAEPDEAEAYMLGLEAEYITVYN